MEYGVLTKVFAPQGRVRGQYLIDRYTYLARGKKPWMDMARAETTEHEHSAAEGHVEGATRT